jgi:hypothetical protein
LKNGALGALGVDHWIKHADVGLETGRSGVGVAKYRRLPHPNSIFTITKQAKNDMMNGILNALWFETRST